MRVNTYLVSVVNREDPSDSQDIIVVSEDDHNMQCFVEGKMVDEFGNPVVLDPPLRVKNPRVTGVKKVRMPVIKNMAIA